MQKLFTGFLLLYTCTGILGQHGPAEINNLTNLPGSYINNYLLKNSSAASFKANSFERDSLSPSRIKNIRFLDARVDNATVGFTPVENTVTKKDFGLLELLINNAPVQWLQENTISEYPETGTSGVRELVLVMQKFWFSNSASERYTVSKPKLLTTLYYNFDVYSSTGYGYFPQTTFSGSLTTLYKRGDAYNELANALLVSLQETLVAKSFKAKETDMNWLSPIAFTEYYDERKKKTSQLADVPRGMYATYNDFLAKKPITDSVEILVIYNEYETETYACQFTAYRNEQPLSCYRNWGYFDGSCLFLNTGNGFYIKLTRNKEDYVFANLKEINKQHIKSYLTSSIQIGNSAYEVIKDYARAFNLTYKLDYDTGKLY